MPDKSCHSIYRIITAMKYYSSINDDESSVMNFVTTTYKSLLDDYIHITQFHNHHVQHIMNRLINQYGFDKCNYSSCKSLSRHYGSYQLSSFLDDSDYIFYKNLFDTIHCFLFHSCDLGLRTSNNPL